MSTRRRNTRTVNVHFFRVIVDGERAPLKRIDAVDLHKRIDGLPFSEASTNSRYFRSALDDLFIMWSSYETGFPKQLRLLAVRELPDASPAYELQGAYEFVDLGTEAARWVAPTYCVIFSEVNLAGMIYSVEGPRPAQISQYLENPDGVGSPCKIEFEALANPDISKELQRLRSIQKLQLQYHPSTAPSLFRGQHADLDGAMAALIDMREAATITITVDAGRKSGARLSELKEKILGLIGRGPLLGSASKFVVTGKDQYTNKTRPVDLLKQTIMATKTVSLALGGKHLDQNAAFEAIGEAYAEHLTQFPSVQITDSEGMEE